MSKKYKVIKVDNYDNNVDDEDESHDNKKILKPRFNDVKYKDRDIKPPSLFLSARELKSKVENFKQVNSKDIENLPIGSRIIYFEVIDINGEKKFKYKPGGNLISNGFPKYLYITNGKVNWSVQLENHVIFKLNNQDDINEKYEKKIRKLKMKVSLLESENKKLIKKLNNK